LDFHGGALILLGGAAGRRLAIGAAMMSGLRTIAVDYRMPPDHSFPAALDDGVAVYRALLAAHRPYNIVVGGTSAGGNLAAATILRARDEGLPTPSCAILLAPELDLTQSGDSFGTVRGLDPAQPGQGYAAPNALYAGGHDLAHPYLSPLFGDFGKGFPPTFLQAGTRDLFLSNAVRMHVALKQKDIPAELHIYEAMPHPNFGGAPEDRQVMVDAQRFLQRHIGVLHLSEDLRSWRNA
jgi:acetyl esterase/lipase